MSETPSVAKWAPVFVAAITLVTFLPALRNGFVNWDDFDNFLRNPYYRGFSWDHIRWMLTSFHMGVYIPLTWMSLCMDFSLWGMNPWGYHLTNVVFHTANAVLVFYIMRVLAETYLEHPNQNLAPVTWAATAAALFFSIHPLRVESVVWITERRDVLAGFFFLLTILLYVKPIASTTGRILPYFTYILALCSKATGMTLPLLLWVLDMALSRLPPGDFLFAKGINRLKEKWLYILISIPFSFLALYGQKQVGTMAPAGILNHATRLGLLACSVFFYIQKTVWPLSLSPFYDMPPWVLHETWAYVLAYTPLVGGCFIVISKRWQFIIPASLWYLIALLPNSGFAQTGFQMAADRYSYIPCMSWAALLGLGFGTFIERPGLSSRRSHIKTRSALAGCSVFLICSLLTLTRKQIVFWSDSYSLWEHALHISPTSPMAHIMMGRVMLDKQDYPQAVMHFAQASSSPFTSYDAHNDWGVALASMGRLQEALPHFQFVLAHQPNDSAARRNYERALSLLRQ